MSDWGTHYRAGDWPRPTGPPPRRAGGSRRLGDWRLETATDEHGLGRATSIRHRAEMAPARTSRIAAR